MSDRAEATQRGTGRRGFLGALLAVASSALAALWGVRPGASTAESTSPPQGPREVELCDADLYGPHDLAG